MASEAKLNYAPAIQVCFLNDMIMGIGKKIIALFILSLTLPSLWGQVIDSPDRNLKLSFDVNNNGTPIYSLDYKE